MLPGRGLGQVDGVDILLGRNPLDVLGVGQIEVYVVVFDVIFQV